MRELSRKQRTSDTSMEHINRGSLQRIADALEKVAINYESLLKEKRLAEKMCDDYRNAFKFQQRISNALRGVITKMKKGTK